MKISLIATIFNEEENIINLLDSLSLQTKMPDEIILVDGGSTDNTFFLITNFKFPISNVKVLKKSGNRSVGRNEAIKNATSDIIVCTDSGCVLDKNWIEEITKPFQSKSTDVVAGYYKGYAKNVFQKCLIPYVLVMPDRVNHETFLPAARSIAFRKSVWKRIGGFPEQFSNNEDYVFARKLKDMGIKIIFRGKAIVYWIPRKNIFEVFYMFFRFAKGDAEAKIFRPKVSMIFTRYIFGILLLFSAIINGQKVLFKLFLFLIILYFLWAIIKNFKYVNNIRAFMWLPILQITSDIAVIYGTIMGLLKLWDLKKTH